MDLVKTWMNGKIVDDAKVHVFNQSFNWSISIYESIKIYATEKGPAIFRLDKHIKRLFYSASVLNIDLPYTEKGFRKAVTDLVGSADVAPAAIRVNVFFADDKFGINIIDSKVNIAIGLFRLTDRKSRPVKVKISRFRKTGKDSTIVDAKITGNYVNPVLAFIDARKDGFDDAVLLDNEGFMAEATIANIFMIKDGKFYTPKKDKILPGITRDSIIHLLKDAGKSVTEKDITPGFMKSADCIFMCGTSREILPVCQIDDTKIDTKSKELEQLRKMFGLITSGKIDHEGWLTYINTPG